MSETKIILDACCGSRMFWFDKENPLHCSSKKRKFEKRAINKFRRKQLKLDEIIKCNRFGKYWA